MNINSDYSVTITNALINKGKLSEILGLITNEKWESDESLGPILIKSTEFIYGKGYWVLSDGDDKLRGFMANYNQVLLDANFLEETMTQYPQQLKSSVYFDFVARVK